MIRVTVDKYCTVRSRGTGIFAGSATDAYIVNDLRDDKRTFIWDHGTGLGWAVLGTGTAGCLFCFYNAVILDKDCFPDLGEFFCLEDKRHYSSRRADIGTYSAFVITKTTVKVHPGLHYSGETEFADRWLQDTGGAGTDA